MKCEMIDTLAIRQPENWLYEIRQKGVESTCYVMVPNANVCFSSISMLIFVHFLHDNIYSPMLS